MDLQKIDIAITNLARAAQNIRGEIPSNLTSFLKKRHDSKIN